jgi:short-subunit dehydrogenase
MKRKIAIISGATRGLGLALTEMILRGIGFDVICLVRNINRLSALKKYADGEHISIFQCDYSNIQESFNTSSIFSNIRYDDYSEIIFINNVSDCEPIGRIGMISSFDISQSITINISSNLIVLNNFLKEVYRQGIKASILDISSGISHNPVAGLGLYGLAKASMDYITLVLNKEIEGSKVKVSAFYPGGMNTTMQSTLQSRLKRDVDLNKFSYEKIYCQNLLSPDEVAEIIFDNFLISDKGWEKEVSSIYDYQERH